MNIVVLDGHAMNPGDLSWDGLAALGDFTVHERTSPGEVVQRAASAEIVLTNKVALTREVIETLPSLRYIGVLATGHNIVDSIFARERGIPVTNVPEYSTISVAQTVFAHVLNLTHHVAQHASAASAGKWAQSPDFCFWDFPLVELSGKTMGIIGFGRIGRATARIAEALGMEVAAHHVRKVDDAPGVRFLGLAELLAGSDVVSLHCPLTAENKGFINAERLLLMKPSAFFVNTARGPLVDEQALADALNQGRIAGAGVDVLSSEPPSAENPLLTAKNCFVTPHVAWATGAARKRLMEQVTANVEAFLEGSPINVVN